MRKVLQDSAIRDSPPRPGAAPGSRTPTRCAAPRRSPAPSGTRSTTPQRVAGWELASPSTTRSSRLDGRVESNGNFHGAPVAYVLDFLAIAAADLATIAERRTDRFLDEARSHGLPPFLADDPGVDSGLMIAQYTQAAGRLGDEAARGPGLRRLDPVARAMQEDHVSMGWSAARKLRRAVDGLARVLAIELLTAARGLELRAPLSPARPPARGVAALRAAGARPRPGPLALARDRDRRPARPRRRRRRAAESVTGPLT